MANELMKRLDKTEPPMHDRHVPADLDAAVARMAVAGQALAVHWGHQPWSESWAHLVAQALLTAAMDEES